MEKILKEKCISKVFLWRPENAPSYDVMTVLRYMTDYMTDPRRHDGRRDSLGGGAAVHNPTAPWGTKLPSFAKDGSNTPKGAPR